MSNMSPRLIRMIIWPVLEMGRPYGEMPSDQYYYRLKLKGVLMLNALRGLRGSMYTMAMQFKRPHKFRTQYPAPILVGLLGGAAIGKSDRTHT